MILLVVASYALPIVVALSFRIPAVSPVWALLLFFNMHYGAQSLYRPWLDMSAFYSPDVHGRYELGILLANVFMGIGLVVSRTLIGPAQATFAAGPAAGEHPLAGRYMIAAALLYCAAFAALDGPGLPRTTELIRYLLEVSSFSYEMIRRKLFSGSIYELAANYTRQSSSIMLLGLLAIAAWSRRGLEARLAFVVTALLVFLLASLQLNKFPIIYALSATAVMLHVYARNDLLIGRRTIFQIVALLIVLYAVLQTLYFVQYRDAIERGYVAAPYMFQLLFYRSFLNQADSLRFWFAEFPDSTPFLGLSTFGIGAQLIGVPEFNVEAFLPGRYIAAFETTFVGGFIGAGYAAFGYYGIGVYAVIVAVVTYALTRMTHALRHRGIRAVYVGACFMNVYFLNSRELTTAMLSGGLIVVPILALAFDRLLSGPRTSSFSQYPQAQLLR